MLDNIATMFDDMKSMMKHLKKKNYETNMDQFLKKYGSYFAEMTQHLEATEQKDVAVKELANCFVSEVEKRFATGKKNRIPSYVQADLNLFMIYYVFPGILKTEHENASMIADGICAKWGETFKDSKIGYTDYDTLYQSFKEKIFGIF